MGKVNSDIKVLHIITLFSLGGATENTVYTAMGLVKKGYTVHIITGPNVPSEGSMYEFTERNGIPVFTFNHLKRAIRPISDLAIIIQLTRFVRKNKYTIVHTHSSKAGVVGRIAAWFAGTPIVIHHNHANPYHRFQNVGKKSVYKFVEKCAGLLCDKIVSVSHTIVDEMVSDNLAPKEKFRVIRSGFDIDRFKNFDDSNDHYTKEKFGISDKDIVFGKIARLSVIKGHIYLLKAFQQIVEKIPDAKLILIGSGENKKNLEDYITENKLTDHVIFSGLVKPDEIPSLISILDIVVHTALLEGLPRVFTQAMLMSKPVISFDLDGAHEVIDDGKNGYLIEPLNIDMLTEKMIELGLNLDKTKEMGQYAKNNIKDDFTVETMVERNHELYQELLKNKKLIA